MGISHIRYMDTKTLLKGIAEVSRRLNPLKPNYRTLLTLMEMLEEVSRRIRQGDEHLLTDDAWEIISEAEAKLRTARLVELEIPMIENGIVDLELIMEDMEEDSEYEE